MADPLPLIPVLYACDANYLPHASACIASLIENNPEFRFRILVVGTRSFGAAQEIFERSFAGKERADISLQQFVLPADTHFPLPYHLTAETYIRMWIADLFEGMDRALYLDPDMIVCGSIAPLWHTDLRGRAVAAVPIPASTRPAFHGMPAGSLFFSAGALLFDLEAWRGRNYRDICLQYLRDHPEKALDGDQDILNLCLMNDWLPLPYRWNVISPFYSPSPNLGLSQAEIDEVRREARIIHFNGASKPWSYFSDHPRRDEYWKYLRRTGWRDMRPADYTFFNVIRRNFGRRLPKPVKQLMRSIIK